MPGKLHPAPKRPAVPASRFRALVALISLLAVAGASACSKPLEKEAHAGPAASPKFSVTVAEAVAMPVTEFSEHTGHTESVSTVEIRARATGYLVRAAFKEGELVKKGQLLFVVDQRPYQAEVARARAELVSVRVDRKLAAKNAARSEALFKSSVISEQEWDSQSSNVELLAAKEDVASAAVNSAELDLEYATIRSPIDGRIGRMLVTPGNLVGPSLPTPLATVVAVDPLYVYLDVDESRALRLARAAADPKTHSLPSAHVGFAGEDGYPHVATLDFLDNRVDPQSGLLKVRAVLPNPDGHFVHGLFARVELPEDAAHGAVLVADLAVATDQDRRFLWVVGADGKVQRRQVTLGPLSDGLRVVRSGLQANERVVVRGLQRVRPGSEVAATTIPMQAAARGELVAEAKP
jgi:RND family efflux transporter MFP subunit